MGVTKFPRSHRKTSHAGRGTPDGHIAPEGQFSENQVIDFSSRRTWMSAPRSSAPNFLVSPNARQLTVDNSMPSMSAYACATERSWSIPVMAEISVKLPHSSRVMLPQANLSASGYATAMKAKDNIRTELLKWIDDGLSKTGLKQTAAEKKAGHSSAIRNLRTGKSDSWSPGVIRDFIGVLGQPPAALTKALLDGTSALSANHMSPIERMEAELAAIERRADELRNAIRVWKQVSEQAG